MENTEGSMIYLGGNIFDIYKEYHLTNLKQSNLKQFSPQIIGPQWLDIMKDSQNMNKKITLNSLICHPCIFFAEVSI